MLIHAMDRRNADEIRSHRRALNSGLARLEEATNRTAQANRWDKSTVDALMLKASGSAAGVLGEADHMLRELEAENRDNWEQRAEMQARRVISHTAIANEILRAADWTIRDCHGYLEELDDELRAWQRVSRELSLSELSIKMRTAAKKRANNVDTEVNRAIDRKDHSGH
jgi:hypothetical protein